MESYYGCRSDRRKISVCNNFLEELLDHPYERKSIKLLKGELWIEEVFTNKANNRIDCEIRCGRQGDDFWNGSVEVYIEIERFKNKHCARFECLEVPSRIANHGIGTTLMLLVIEIIKTFKEFYSVGETVSVSGWLSMSDKLNGNWNKSVPFYEKIGHLANIESYFIIKNNENHYTAEDFLRISNDDGSIIYLI